MTTRSRRMFTDVVRRDQVDLALACTLIANETEPVLQLDVGWASLDALAESARLALEAAVRPRAGGGG
nr:hypothetical protein [Micromonospora sp. DSM 115978]